MENKTSKVHFLLGLFVGIAIISTAAFFTLLATSNNEEGTTKTAKSNTNVNQVVNTNTNPVVTAPPAVAGELPEITESDHVRGDFNAPVTLIEFSDFECPYCFSFQPTLEKLLTDYEGKVRLVYKHFPLSFHANAQKAAEASECATEQGKFWEMHDLIFEANGNKVMSVSKWKEFADNLGLNVSQFNDCLDSGKYVSKIKADATLGNMVGVQGTPATFVNGELVGGAVPYESIKAVVDSKL